MNRSSSHRPAPTSPDPATLGAGEADACSAEPMDWPDGAQVRGFMAMAPQVEMWAMQDQWDFRLLV
jgi:hypothetical protein